MTIRADIETVTQKLKRDLHDEEKRLLSALDSVFLLDYLTSDNLIELFDVLQSVSKSTERIHSCTPTHGYGTTHGHGGSNISAIAQDIAGSLDTEWISEASDLSDLLTSPHLSNLLRIYDAVSNQEIYSNLPYKRPASSFRPESAIYQSLDHLTNVYDYPHHQPFYDEYDRGTEKTESKLTVKMVQIIKGSEPLGVTVTINDATGGAVITRILYGGAGHRSGLINVGDLIFEVNGINLRCRGHRDIISLLEKEAAKEEISFKLLVGLDTSQAVADSQQLQIYQSSRSLVIKDETLKEQGIFVKVHFDYNPFMHLDHPCPQVGLLFKKGEILEIVNKDDPNWWQARHQDDLDLCSRAGLIPSPSNQEKRMATERGKKYEEYLNAKVEIIPGFKSPIRKGQWSRKERKMMYRVQEMDQYEEADLPTYEEVIHLYPSSGFCRPIVLFGSSLSGRNRLIRRLIHTDHSTYQVPLAHTSRPKREDEEDGVDYIFVSRDNFDCDLTDGHFLEYEEYNGHLYGIHRETVRNVIASGGICLLALQPSGLKTVRNPLFKPYVVFLKPDPDILYGSCLEVGCPRNNNLYVQDSSNTRMIQNPVTLRQPGEDEYKRPSSLKDKEITKEGQQQFNSRACSSDRDSKDRELRMKIKRNPFKHMGQQERSELIQETAKLEYLYGHLFDVILLVGDDMDESFVQLLHIIRSVQLVPQWAPASWL